LSFDVGNKIILSFDVEHWYLGFKLRGITSWQEDSWRDKNNIEIILSILEKNNCRSTFFVTGEYAESYPEVVKGIYEKGHEIACHGYSHDFIYNQSPKVFKQETIRSKNILSDLINNEINGYRAASWSINNDSLWALDIIYEAGFKYDSSIYPTKNHRYGIYNAYNKPYKIQLSNNRDIIEVPPQTLKVGNLRLPVCGGVYLRVFPLWMHKWAINRSNNLGFPGSVMLHPHELDPDPPIIKIGLEGWLIKYFRITKVKSILENILSEYNSITYNQFLKEYDHDKFPKNSFSL